MQLPQKSCRRARSPISGRTVWWWELEVRRWGVHRLTFCAVLDRLSPAFRAQHPPSTPSPADAQSIDRLQDGRLLQSHQCQDPVQPDRELHLLDSYVPASLLPPQRRGQSGRSRLNPTVFFSPREPARPRPPAHLEASASVTAPRRDETAGRECSRPPRTAFGSGLAGVQRAPLQPMPCRRTVRRRVRRSDRHVAGHRTNLRAPWVREGRLETPACIAHARRPLLTGVFQQTSGAPCPTSVSPWPLSWTRRSRLICESPSHRARGRRFPRLQA